MVAITDIDNIASQKLLEKNGFVFVTIIANKKSYIIDLRYTKKDIEFATNVMAWHEEQRRIFEEKHYGGK
jgi:RimJ/RimL family protein N-acetyltransferase